MTKKRYIKLLMSKGFQIREARLMAKMDVSLHGSYRLAELCTSPLMYSILETAIGNMFGSAIGKNCIPEFLLKSFNYINCLEELEARL